MTVQINGTNGIQFPDGINPNSDKNLAESGYQKLPGGLIIQWATLTSVPATGNGAIGTINFPIAFPNNCFNVTISSNIGIMAATSADEGLSLRSKSLANFTYENQWNSLSVSSTRLFSYIAIGN